MHPDVRRKITVNNIQPSAPCAIETPSPSSSRLPLLRGDAKRGETDRIPRLDVIQRLERMTWDNDRLRRELELEREEHRNSVHARTYIVAEANRVVESLQNAIEAYGKLNVEIAEDSVRH